MGNVTTAKGFSGAIYRGDTTATLPTSTTAATTGFTALGWVSEDGASNSNSPSSDSIKGWGGDTVLTYQSEKEDKFTFTLISALDPNVLKAVYGDDNVTGSLSEGLVVKANSDPQEEKAWIIDMILVNDVKKRIVIPKARITEIGDVTYKDDEAVGYKITLTAVAADSDGNTHFEYIK